MDDGTNYGPEGSVDFGALTCWCYVLRYSGPLLDLLWWMRR